MKPRGPRYGFFSEADVKEFAKREDYVPAEWTDKCGVKGEAGDGWDKYVDDQWDAAYEHAFGVTAFREFLSTELPRMVNLDLHNSKAVDPKP